MNNCENHQQLSEFHDADCKRWQGYKRIVLNTTISHTNKLYCTSSKSSPITGFINQDKEMITNIQQSN